VGLADRELRIDEDRPFGLAVAKRHAGDAPPAVAIGGNSSVRPRHLEPAEPNDSGHQAIEPTVHPYSPGNSRPPGQRTILMGAFKYCLRRCARTTATGRVAEKEKGAAAP